MSSVFSVVGPGAGPHRKSKRSGEHALPPGPDESRRPLLRAQHQVGGERAHRLGAAAWAGRWAVTGARSRRILVDRIAVPVRGRLVAELPPAARTAVLDAALGQYDAAWLCAFDAAPDGLAATSPRLEPLAALARSCGWWWPCPEVAVLSERPRELHRDNVGRLHRGDGPAVAYPDGWGVRAWRGTAVPAELAARLDRLTADDVTGETNAEVRRVMLEHLGHARYRREAGARQCASDEYGTLWSILFRDDEPLVMVEVVNASPEPDGSYRTYWLRVLPQTRTPHEAVAWTFGLTPEEYHPLAQT